MTNNPIFITGVERSGASIIARLLDITGKVYYGDITVRYENKEISNFLKLGLLSFSMDPRGQFPVPESPLPIIKSMEERVQEEIIIKQGKLVWVYKTHLLLHTYKTWQALYPQARWIFVRRKPGDIIESCKKTGYMTAYESKLIQQQVGVNNEYAGWKWWIDWGEMQMEALIKAGVDYKIVWPDRLADGDYSQVLHMLRWLNLPWNHNIVPIISKLFKTTKVCEQI